MESIMLWGAGSTATIYIYKYRNIIEGVIDSDETKCVDDVGERKSILGIPVWKPNEILGKSGIPFIVVTTSRVNYYEIKDVLSRYGMTEYEDYIWAPLYGKKLIALHGNCHVNTIKGYLRSNEEFNARYGICEIPLIQLNKDGHIDMNLLKHLDVFVHQDIRKDNQFGERLSDEYNRQFLKRECVDITIPNLFGYGRMFFPGHCSNPYNYVCEYNTLGLLPGADRALIECFEKNMSVEQICNYLLKNPYSNIEIINNFNENVRKLREREKNWDIPVTDFLMENYKDKKLFHDPNHPTLFVMKYITEKLLDMLGIKDRHLSYDVAMNDWEVFIYPCVMNALGMSYDNQIIRVGNSNKIVDKMGFEEFIKTFCYIGRLKQDSD
jgi:hypothetical protein